MLKLRDLFNNPDLAEMLLHNWEHDQPSAQLFSRFRISSNAIYPFRRNGETCFLRFCPVAEKSPDTVAAELELITYLRGHGYRAPQAIPSVSGELLVVKDTPWGSYIATAFKSSGSTSFEEIELTNEALFAVGQSLGALHALSREYREPSKRRPSHLDIFNWIESVLTEIPGQQTALRELAILKEYFAALPISPATYGLIHYDFDPDNVLVDPTTLACSPIDFDDCMYHWYACDIEQGLDGLKPLTTPETFPRARQAFFDGYLTQSPIPPDLLQSLPTFRRFSNLYSYTRILRSTAETWDHEPEWMCRLRSKLSAAIQRKSAQFGTPMPT